MNQKVSVLGEERVKLDEQQVKPFSDIVSSKRIFNIDRTNIANE